MKTLINKLSETLKKDTYFLDENEDIIIDKVKTAAINMDDHLLDILVSDDEFKEAFFIKKIKF